MSDFEKLINASDLIEWIMETYPDWCVGTVRSIVDHVEALPSAQPDVPDTNVGDLISRQQAIDTLDKHIDTFDAIDTNYLCGLRTAMSFLKEMPPAQPERQVELDGTESNIEILSELRAQFNCFDEAEEPCYRALSDAICALSAQPQRKTARWEILYPNHTYKYHCSECGANHKYMFDFCPSCGARMESDDDEE